MLANNSYKRIRRGGELMELHELSTKDLVEELRNRKGVKSTIVEPYVTHKIQIEGPAIVMEIID